MDSSQEYFDLGTYGRRVRTDSPAAQTWFDRGLNWTYGFNHEEAAACFRAAIEADPSCLMAYWGLAYALGPNYNKPWEAFDPDELGDTVHRTHAAVETALGLLDDAGDAAGDVPDPAEAALVRALQHRYPQDVPAEDCAIWNPPYADAMGEVYAQHPDDLDVATLYADALMNLTPWELWDLRTGEPAPGSRALEARRVLDHALTLPGGAEHPGVLHMYIHLMEMSSAPEEALPIADRLRGLVPDAGHLQHMPTHLDVLCGDYRRVVDSNTQAIAADDRFVAKRGPMNFYTLYRAHDHHFRIYGAMFLGQSQGALDAVEALERAIPDDLLRVESPPMADWLEGFLAMRVHVLIRFGRWSDILALEMPEDAALYATSTAMLHYAKGVAAAALGQIDEADRQRELFLAAKEAVPESRMLFNNTCRDLLEVGDAMQAGEIAYRKGAIDDAFAHLRRAIDLDDNLPYDEPWGWMQPTRHAYGALLLEQGRVDEAAEVYEADLGISDALPRALQHPGNVWALHGYHECLCAQGRTGEARIIERQLTLARAMADVAIDASCFCRLGAVDASAHEGHGHHHAHEGHGHHPAHDGGEHPHGCHGSAGARR